MINYVGVGKEQGIELFITHWKYGVNYEDSTVLVDPFFIPIAIYDRNTENIDVIVCDVPHQEHWIIYNEKLINVVPEKFKYMDYKTTVYLNYKNVIEARKKGTQNEYLAELKQQVAERNKTYLSTLCTKKS